MRTKRWVVGNPLSTDHAAHEKISKLKALAVLASDALSSVSYATEEILIVLSTGALLAAQINNQAYYTWALPVAASIVGLLFILTLSYRQTLKSYPGGGGAYSVARDNLGANWGLVAGAALLVDYVLTVSVAVSAGVQNIASAFPSVLEHREAFGIGLILLLMVFNLRGLRESATIFAIPTYFFIFSVFLMIIVGIYKLVNGIEVVPSTAADFALARDLSTFLILRSFASGCVALTGIEAISNGIPMFREPESRNAKITMAWMAGLLGFFFLGVTYLAHEWKIVPSPDKTVISMLATQILGNGFIYYFVQASVAAILILAANTAYAGFPRLCSIMAKDRYLPRQLASLGDRLVFSNGIIGLSLASIFLIVLFKGDTHLLIPLYAVGVFLSFSLSQSGMVMHHWKHREPKWISGMLINAVGALTTIIVLMIIGISKFATGAWITIFTIPALVFLFRQIRRHYEFAAAQLAYGSKLKTPQLEGNLAVLPVSGLHPGVVKAVHYARMISNDIKACVVDINPQATKNLESEWQRSLPDIPLIVLPSPYRSVLSPILTYIDEMKAANPNKMITVIIPEFVTRRWYHRFLHNQTALILHAFLRAKRNIVVTSVRYHLR